jgi:hypothetical protein
MLSLPSTSHPTVSHTKPSASGPADTPIDIPCHSVTLRFFIELMEQRPLTPCYELAKLYPAIHPLHGQGEGAGMGSLRVIADLLRRFDCSEPIWERALTHFRKDFSADPWFAFCIAAEHGDTINAERALLSFRWCLSGRSVDPVKMKVKDVQELPIGWFLGYMRAFNEARSKLTVSTLGFHARNSTSNLGIM